MDPGPFFYIYITFNCKHRLLSTSNIYLFTANKYPFPDDIYCKTVRLTTSLQVGAKYLGCVLCRFHVAAGAEATPQTFSRHHQQVSGVIAKVS
jgi:hypothetical protein